MLKIKDVWGVYLNHAFITKREILIMCGQLVQLGDFCVAFFQFILPLLSTFDYVNIGLLR